VGSKSSGMGIALPMPLVRMSTACGALGGGDVATKVDGSCWGATERQGGARMFGSQARCCWALHRGDG
jgi:hypothetical protein